MEHTAEYTSPSNKFMVWVLRSPFHFLLSKNTIVLRYSGCKTGRKYATPMNYVREGDTLYVTSLPSRNWWRNLVVNPSANVLIKRKLIPVTAETFRDQSSVNKYLEKFFTLAPEFAKYFHVQLNPDKTINQDDLTRAASERVVIVLHLEPAR